MRAGCLLVLMLLLAGCSEKTSQPAQVVLVDSSETVEVDGNGSKPSERTPKAGERGHISGVVVDPAIVPVEGVVVRLPGADRQAISDEEGVFAFRDLWPGPYYLEADAQGWLPVTAEVEVPQDQIVRLRIVVEREPSEDPYHETQKFVGFAELAGDPFVRPGMMCSQCTFRAFHEPGPDTVVLEGVRTRPIEGDALYQEGYYMVVEKGDGEQVERGLHPEPLLRHLPGEVLEGSTALRVEMAPTSWPLPEQSVEFEVFMTFFYHGEAPDGWTVREAQ